MVVKEQVNKVQQGAGTCATFPTRTWLLNKTSALLALPLQVHQLTSRCSRPARNALRCTKLKPRLLRPFSQ